MRPGPEQLWKSFESTGRVDDYLRFKQQAAGENEENDAENDAGAGAAAGEIP